MLIAEMKHPSKFYYMNGMYRVKVGNSRINAFVKLKDALAYLKEASVKELTDFPF